MKKLVPSVAALLAAVFVVHTGEGWYEKYQRGQSCEEITRMIEENGYGFSPDLKEAMLQKDWEEFRKIAMYPDGTDVLERAQRTLIERDCS